MAHRFEDSEALARNLSAYLGHLMDYYPVGFASERPDSAPVAAFGPLPVMIYRIEPSTPGVTVYFYEDGEEKHRTVIDNANFHSFFQPHVSEHGEETCLDE